MSSRVNLHVGVCFALRCLSRFCLTTREEDVFWQTDLYSFTVDFNHNVVAFNGFRFT
ncbi:MAG: hypothetical protein ACKOFA_04500 [Rhodoluna sp.]